MSLSITTATKGETVVPQIRDGATIAEEIELEPAKARELARTLNRAANYAASQAKPK